MKKIRKIRILDLWSLPLFLDIGLWPPNNRFSPTPVTVFLKNTGTEFVNCDLHCIGDEHWRP